MSEIEKSARQAQRRLLLNRWLTALGWSLAGAASLFVIAVMIERASGLLENTGRFYGWLLLGLAGGTLISSMVWALVTREDLRLAAAKLDEAAGLKERISTGLYCTSSTDPFAQAVVADAERISRGLPVRRHLPVRVPPSAPWAGGTVLVAFLFFCLFPVLDLSGRQEQQQEKHDREQRVARAQVLVQPMIAPNLKQLRESNPALKKELDELDALKDAKLETPAELRQEMMKKVEQLARKLEQQSENPELNKVAEFKQMMRKLESSPKGNTPVSDLSKALAQGDLKAAQQAIAAAQQQLAKEAKTPEEKQKAEQLKQELQNLSDKLNEIAKDDKKMRETLAKSGLNEKEIQQALDKLSKKDIEGLKKQLADKGLSKEQVEQLAKQMQKKCSGASAASKLSQALSKAGALKQGGDQMAASAADGLSDAAQQLSQMESMEQQLNELQASMGQVNAMKSKIGESCPQCNGTGMKDGQPCPGCQGTGLSQFGQNQGAPGGGLGFQIGGAGGFRPQEETAFNTVKRQARVLTGSGSVIAKQEFEDGQIKGEVSKEFTDAVISAQREVADNIANEKIPRPYQRGISQYFNHLKDDAKPTPKNEK
jgi:hypothetical protein